MAPYRSYQQKVNKYKYTFLEVLQKAIPIDTQIRKELKDLQNSLGLQDEDIKKIEGEVLTLYEKTSSNLLFLFRSLLSRRRHHNIPENIGKNLKNLRQAISSKTLSSVENSRRFATKLKHSVLTLRTKTLLTISQIKPLNIYITLATLLATASLGSFLYITDRHAKTLFLEALSLRREENYFGCSSTIERIPDYTRFSPKFSERTQSILEVCNTNFQQEEFAIAHAQNMMSQTTISRDEAITKLDQVIQNLNKVSSSSVLSLEVEALSDRVLANIKELYANEENFESMERLVELIPDWTDASVEGEIWISETFEQRKEKIQHQSVANDSILNAQTILQDIQNMNRLQIAHDFLQEARSALNSLNSYQLDPWWVGEVQAISSNLEYVQTELDMQNQIVQQCVETREAFLRGDAENINRVLHLDSQSRSQCNEVGISLPTESDLGSILTANPNLCVIVTTSSLKIYDSINENQLVISELLPHMVIQRIGNDFERSLDSYWIKVSAQGGRIGWIAAVRGSIQNVENCIRRGEDIRSNLGI